MLIPEVHFDTIHTVCREHSDMSKLEQEFEEFEQEQPALAECVTTTIVGVMTRNGLDKHPHASQISANFLASYLQFYRSIAVQIECKELEAIYDSRG